MRSINEGAVSEVVGAILLVSVAVLGVGIVAMTILSQPTPSETPHVSITAGAAANGTFALIHEGGDALRNGDYRIYVDAESGLEERTDDFVPAGGDGVWSIGEVLMYAGPGTPQKVVISFVDHAGGETVIAEPGYTAGVVDAGGYVDAGGSGAMPVKPGEETPFSPPVVITDPSIDGSIDWSKAVNYTATVDANATRVDLVVYDFSETAANKVTVYTMENTTPETYYKVLNIVGNTAKKGNDASITVIAYNKTEVIGYDTIIVAIDGR